MDFNSRRRPARCGRMPASGHSNAAGAHSRVDQEETAAWLHALLAGIGLPAFVKTPDKTGLHVALPIRRTLTFGVVRDMAHVIGARLLRAHPDGFHAVSVGAVARQGDTWAGWPSRKASIEDALATAAR